jgi:hypothetical protein
MHVSYAHAVWSKSIYRSLPIFVSHTTSGFGTVVSPLICQTVLSKGISWPYFYYGSLLLAAANILLASTAFTPTPSELEEERRKASCDSQPSSAASTPTDVKEKYFPITKPTPPASGQYSGIPPRTISYALSSPPIGPFTSLPMGCVSFRWSLLWHRDDVSGFRMCLQPLPSPLPC